MILARLAPLALALFVLDGNAEAQTRKPDEKWRLDPYTKNDEEAIRAAGYVSYGPFPFGDGHDTAQVEHVLGTDARILWVETAHFRIGCGLPEYRVSETVPGERKKVREELRRLRDRLPGVKPDSTRLDPWLRLHLAAQRAEDLYVDFRSRLGVTEAEFPEAGEATGQEIEPGRGPYLGQPSKYTVLLVEKASTFGHYFRTFAGRDARMAHRHNFLGVGSLFFGTALEFLENEYATDTGLHCLETHALVHNLIDGYRGFTRAAPLWWSEGLAHWYARRIHPQFVFTGSARHSETDPRRVWRWEPRVRARVEVGEFPKAAEIFGLARYEDMDFVHFMTAWSRVDFGMSLGNEKFRAFMDAIKGTEERTSAEAVREAWGFDEGGFDRAWGDWVLENYPR